MASHSKPVPSQGLAVVSAANAIVGSGGPVGLNTAQADGAIFASAARAAATYTSNAMFAPDVKGVMLYINITNANGGSLVAKIQGQDNAGNWVDLAGAVTASLASNAETTLAVYPGETVTANVSVSSPLPPLWRISVTVSTQPVTFNINGMYLG